MVRAFKSACDAIPTFKILMAMLSSIAAYESSPKRLSSRDNPRSRFRALWSRLGMGVIESCAFAGGIRDTALIEA
jgi:hypothetical protein